MKQSISRLLFFIPLFYPYYAQAVVIGSPTAVSIENAILFPSADLDNAFEGFGWCTAGFTLEDTLTICTFDCVFPVSGDIVLNGGTLYLLKNMIISDVATLQSIGYVVGNNHCLQLAQSVGQLTSNGGLFENVTLICNGDLDVIGTFTFSGHCTLQGMGNTLDLTEGGSIFVESNSSLEFSDVTITGTALACVDDSACITLDDVTWVQPASMSFYAGSITFEDDVQFINQGTFSYESSQTSTIASNARLLIADSMTFSIGRDPITWNEPLSMIDATSLLHIDNAHLITRDPGMCLIKGTVILERGVTLDMNGTTTDCGLILGDGNPANDVTVRLVPGCGVVHNSGWWIYNNGAPDNIQSASITAYLIRNESSLIYIAQNFSINNFTVQIASAMVYPMQEAPGVTVSYNNAGVVLPQSQLTMTASQVNYYTYLLGGSGDLFFTRGTLPFYLEVDGTGNTLHGNGGLSGEIIFLSSASTLKCAINGFINNIIMLNGGTFTLDNDLVLQEGASITGPGIMNLQISTLTVNMGDFNANTPLMWQGSTGFLRHEGKISLTSTWTVSGKVVIDGDGNQFVIGSGGQIIIDEGSQLILKNIEVHGVSGTNICCLDNDGSITFLNAEWFLDGDYSFTVGSLQFSRQNTIYGAYNFAYDTPMTSTVQANAKLYFSDGVNLVLGNPANVLQPLYFENSSATIGFDNSNITVNPTGLQFTRGTFYGVRNVEIEVLSTSTANGLFFGDGTPDGDMRIIMDPGCTAEFDTGHVTFNVTSGDGITSKSKTAELRRGASSYFYLKQNLFLSEITIDVDILSTLVLDPGLLLTYNDGRIVLDIGSFDLIGTRYSDTTSLLSGNNSISLVNGTLPLATLVMGINNSITGVGNVSGPIILMDNNTALTCGITGYLSSYILLNGGSLTLSNDLKLTNGVTFQGSGTVTMGPQNLDMGSIDASWLGDIMWNMDSSTISMYGTIDLHGTWTFSGVGEIKARGQTLSLANGGSIVVAPGSQLALRGVYIDGVSGTNITCLGDDSVLILDDVSWEQYDNYFTFTTGALILRNSVTIRGDGGVFAYESDQTSTVDSYTHVTFDTNITFSYDPVIDSSELFFLSDETSIMQLQSAILYSAATGLLLINGKITVEGTSTMISDVTQTVVGDGTITIVDGGIMLGDGTPYDDCVCTIAHGAQLFIAGGSFIYNNTNPQACIMQNDASVIEIGSAARFFMMQNLTIDKGQIVFDDQAIFTALRGTVLTGATFAQGSFQRNVING